jgi:hypothetical protein
MKSLLLSLTISLLAVVGCNSGVEPYESGANPQSSGVAKTSPSRPAPSSNPAGAAAETIEGTIEVSPALAGQIPPNSVLFLIARSAAPGPPLAVNRMPVPQFPFRFSIGPDDRMIQAMPFAGPITLSVKIDTDGNAMTRTPGDLQAAPGTPFNPGDRDVTLLIDEAI